MIDKLADNNKVYDELINEEISSIEIDKSKCQEKMELLNCTNIEVWKTLRSKHSKNITNMQDKIKRHDETI